MRDELYADDNPDTGDWHVMPNDGKHESNPRCWCQPDVEHRDPVTGTVVWMHKEHVQ